MGNDAAQILEGAHQVELILLVGGGLAPRRRHHLLSQLLPPPLVSKLLQLAVYSCRTVPAALVFSPQSRHQR